MKNIINFVIFMNLIGIYAGLYIFLFCDNFIMFLIGLFFLIINSFNIYDNNKLYLEECNKEQLQDNAYINQNNALKNLELSIVALEAKSYLYLNSVRSENIAELDEYVKYNLERVEKERVLL